LCVADQWSHHWVWCALFGIACADIARTDERVWVRVGAVAAIVPFILGLVFWAPHSSHQELHDSPVQQLASASYVLAGVLMCVLFVVVSYDHPGQRAR
jgi:hypothetical protein